MPDRQKETSIKTSECENERTLWGIELMYRNIHDSFWTDPEVRNWASPAKLLYLYLITNPSSHYSGVYFIGHERISKDTGIPMDKVKGIMDFMGEVGKVKYNSEYECVFVVNMLKYQFVTNKVNCIKGINNHFLTLHRCPLIGDFVNEYPDIEITVEYCNNSIPEIKTEENEVKKKREVVDYKDSVEKVIHYLNVKTGKKYRANTPATKRIIASRFNEGFNEGDFYKVIDNKVTAWLGDPKMSAYLRPETLFGTKFESYLNESGSRYIAKPQPAIDKLIADIEDAPDFVEVKS